MDHLTDFDCPIMFLMCGLLSWCLFRYTTALARLHSTYLALSTDPSMSASEAAALESRRTKWLTLNQIYLQKMKTEYVMLVMKDKMKDQFASKQKHKVKLVLLLISA